MQSMLLAMGNKWKVSNISYKTTQDNNLALGNKFNTEPFPLPFK